VQNHYFIHLTSNNRPDIIKASVVFPFSNSKINFKISETLTCTEPVLKIVDAGYCLYIHIFVLKSLKPFNFNNSNQFMPDLRFQQSQRDN